LRDLARENAANILRHNPRLDQNLLLIGHNFRHHRTSLHRGPHGFYVDGGNGSIFWRAHMGVTNLGAKRIFAGARLVGTGFHFR